jgi:signal transduction histidine kinase
LYNGDPIGILSVDEVSIPEAVDEYLNLAHFIVQIAGLAITIARTNQDFVQTVKERDTEIAERKRTRDALQMALKKLNMLSSITRHDILNQIMGLRGFLELSREDLKGTRYEGFIDKEDQAAEAIQRQIEFTKYYQDIGVNAPKWQDVESIIHEAKDQLNPAGIDIRISISGIEIFADPLIVKVFFNLMENSLRHGERVTRMEFASFESADCRVITYCDNGVGISDGDKKKLFRKGFGKHTGLGLFLSQEILAITGITITETGMAGEGVRFEITVPKGGYRVVKTC